MGVRTTTRGRVRLVVAVGCLGIAAPGLSAGGSPWYVQGKLGQASLEATLGSRHVKTLDDSDSGWSVEIVYRVNRHLAIEAGIHDFGEFRGLGSPCPDSVDACIERLALEGLGLCAEYERFHLDLERLSLVLRWTF